MMYVETKLAILGVADIILFGILIIILYQFHTVNGLLVIVEGYVYVAAFHYIGEFILLSGPYDSDPFMIMNASMLWIIYDMDIISDKLKDLKER